MLCVVRKTHLDFRLPFELDRLFIASLIGFEAIEHLISFRMLQTCNDTQGNM